MIQQRLDRLDEAHCVRQLGVALERSQVGPSGVNIELVRVANRLKSPVATAARLCPRRALYVEHRPVHFIPLAGKGVKAGEHEYFHDECPS